MLITGKITDQATGQPLPNANVYFSGSSGTYINGTTGTISDHNGNYSINGVGEHLTASYTGYAKQTEQAANNINFQLPNDATLPEVNIIASMLWPRIAAVIIVTIVTIWILKPFQP